MTVTYCETPIYDAMLGERATPDVAGELVAHNWEIFGLLSNMLPEREIDRTPRIRIVRVDPHAEQIADVITYTEWRGDWFGLVT